MNDQRCVVILNQQLSAGKAANAAAVIALTLGQRHPQFVGAGLIAADQREYPGLIPVGIPVLAASDQQLSELRSQCDAQQLDIVLFPVEGQQTTDYAAFRAAVSLIPSPDLQLLGLAVTGDKKVLRKLTAKLKLFG
ncbi:DUF2000 family protein [Pantoea sp. B65]|uniref:DUF2000 family protein n=1 Tax=Pantoea sp. B65 TaxID=2813359 RepID=UPI0039B6D98D